jgi:CD2 antigen cytoplasmic tail-binding protein 2
MASRFSAARPKREGENYARQHHNNAEPDSKKVKFDVRNPSALAPDAADDDEDTRDVFLEADADVIRGSAATKRGAVNIDGYDSDSDREELGSLHTSKTKKRATEEDVDDMFAAEDEDPDDKVDDTTGKKSKEVRFMSTVEIQGQEEESKSGGHIRIRGDEESSDDDEEAIALAIQEEDVDEEVGAGGLKKHAPKLEAFNLKQENEEGRFDEAGNFVRKAVDPDAVHDRWLEGVSKKDMRRAAEAHEKREAELRQKRREDDSALTSDLLKSLITHLERGETALEALARLGRSQKNKPKAKKVPKWKQKKQIQKTDSMDVDEEKDKEKDAEDPEQVRIKEAINDITDAADKLLGRNRPDVYDRERELLIREYTRETDEEWVEPVREEVRESTGGTTKTWEYRWTDGRDGADKQGPFDGNMMKAWQDAGYFGEGVEFREVGDETWSRAVDFV